ncbi:MAG: RNA-binding S4 domain-containing protein [Bacteroidales bacterium]|jgi:ribosome-associated heat shock protein Hsp15|nr:RNA-binding S4 domain-containing protein [Bacteroidales bacterium]MDD2771308.1 RNA-binding S4 domain-containing protein [Bacteroidales bacterium]MDD3104608.1 RNA-binding S4 domain-containing protein [Bacteroidales bacterium]MDD3549730.1 RNA-binding S4 domain-containing protein [Bacteroidales bacterium]MDD4063967.1 RNA-binding S4 domain-containing protein [Bacteroidales bacterium]
MRLDKYLWAIRVFKTRSEAADACRGSAIKLNGQDVKPSREVRQGDVLVVRKGPVYYSYRVLQPVENRQPAKNVPLYALDITPPEELDKLQQPRETIVIYRQKGTGRPTKKERRQLDDVMDLNG